MAVIHAPLLILNSRGEPVGAWLRSVAFSPERSTTFEVVVREPVAKIIDAFQEPVRVRRVTFEVREKWLVTDAPRELLAKLDPDVILFEERDAP